LMPPENDHHEPNGSLEGSLEVSSIQYLVFGWRFTGLNVSNVIFVGAPDRLLSFTDPSISIVLPGLVEESLSRDTVIVQTPLHGGSPKLLDMSDNPRVSESKTNEELPVEKESARGPMKPTGSALEEGGVVRLLNRSSARPLRTEMSTTSTTRKDTLFAKAIAHPLLSSRKLGPTTIQQPDCQRDSLDHKETKVLDLVSERQPLSRGSSMQSITHEGNDQSGCLWVILTRLCPAAS